MESRHPDLDAVRAILGRPARVADLPPLEIPSPPKPWSTGITKGTERRQMLFAVLYTLLGAIMIGAVLVAIGALASMP